MRTIYAYAFNGIFSFADPCCVDSGDRNAPDVGGLFDYVSRRTGYWGYNGPFLTKQCIQKARFPHIRSSRNGNADAFPVKATLVRGCG